MIDSYSFLKALHLIAVISWMVGLLYLPRLFVYHVGAESGSDSDKMLQVMEKKLLRYIMNPAMIATLVIGIILAYNVQIFDPAYGKWFHLKSLCLLALFGCHGYLAKVRKDFVNGTNVKTAKFFRIINEVPTILMIIIVFITVTKPF
ncbi:MAG: protoporphyrinogen oxidase HemJ [Pseudomonadota bacterium]